MCARIDLLKKIYSNLVVTQWSDLDSAFRAKLNLKITALPLVKNTLISVPVVQKGE